MVIWVMEREVLISKFTRMLAVVLKSQIQQCVLKERNPCKLETQSPGATSALSMPGKPRKAPKGRVPSAAAVLPAVSFFILSAKYPGCVRLTFPFFSHPISCCVPSSPQLLWQSVTCPTLNPALPYTCNKLTQALNDKERKREWAPQLFQMGACPTDCELPAGRAVCIFS